MQMTLPCKVGIDICKGDAIVQSTKKGGWFNRHS
jgi:hypothetical protein